MQAVAGGMSRGVRNSHTQVNLQTAETILAIEDKIAAARELEDYRQELIDATQKEEHYRKILTPEYLNRIYHPSKGNQVAAGVKSVRLYAALIAEYGEELATDMVVKNPTILGELKGYGIGKLLGLTNDRKGAIALYKIKNRGSKISDGRIIQNI